MITDLTSHPCFVQLDGPEVGSDISKILMREMYRPDMDSGTVLYRISKLINVNPDAARKVFAHSSKVGPKSYFSYSCSHKIKITIFPCIKN